MKKLISIFIVMTLSVLFRNSPAQIQYEMTSENFSINCGIYTELEWDIFIRSTNTGELEYLQGQFSFNFDASISQGGELTFEVISSDLPIALQPGLGIVNGSQLRLAPNTVVPPGSGYIISSSYPGTKIARVRLTTSATSFAVNNKSDYSNQVNLSSPESPFTKIFASVNGTVTDITNSSGIYIEPNYYGMFISETLPWEQCDAKLLNLSAAIEGLYNQSTGTLNRNDTVTVELRQITFPYNLQSSFRSRLDSISLSTFSVQSYQWGPPNPNQFYLVIKHHNAIETWSKIGVTLSRGGYVTSYSFFDSDESAFGNNLKLIGSKYCIYSGDVNQDRIIDITDILMVFNSSNVFNSGYVNEDLNGDNIADLSDLTIVYNNAVNFVAAVIPV